MLDEEVNVNSKLKHRNIAELIDLIETKNTFYFVFELCKEGDLKRLI